MEINKTYLIGGGVLIGAVFLLSNRGGGGGGSVAQTADNFNNAAILSNLETNKMVAAAQPVNVKTTADLMAKLSDNRLATFNSESNLLLSALDMNNQTTTINAAALDKARERSQVLPLAKISAASGRAAVELEKVKGANAFELEKVKGANALALAQAGFDPGTGGNPLNSLFGGNTRAGISPTTGKSYSSMNDWEKNMQWAMDFNKSNQNQPAQSASNNSWIGAAISGVVSVIGALLA